MSDRPSEPTCMSPQLPRRRLPPVPGMQHQCSDPPAADLGLGLNQMRLVTLQMLHITSLPLSPPEHAQSQRTSGFVS